MKSGELQYLADTILLQEIANMEFGLTKQAGLFQDLNLNSIGESIKSFVKSHVSEEAPGGYVGSVVNLMAPAILLRINPILGVLYLIASQFGFDLNGIITKIQQAIGNRLKSGESLTSNDITQIGKDAIGGLTGEAAPNDLFFPLRKYAQPSLESYAQMFSREDISSKLFGPTISRSLPETPILGGKGSILQRVFGTLFSLPGGRGKSKALWLIGGFVIWTIKTVLLGAGLLAGAGLIYKLLSPKTSPSENEPELKHNHETVNPQTIENETTENSSLAPAVKSQDQIKTNQSELWIVPLFKTIENTLLIWIKDIYPEVMDIEDFENKLLNSATFKEVVRLLNNPEKVGKKVIVMPEQFTSRKQVVDLLLKDLK